MQLRTLGALELEGAAFRHPKPLLLLAYLSREGPQPRKRVAELFWPRSDDPLNRLSVMLSRMRKGVTGATWTDGERVGTALRSDVDRLAAALAEERWADVEEIYRGPFLAGVYVRGLSPEMDDWISETADDVARRVQVAYTNAAEAAARGGSLERAVGLAELAAAVAGCAPEGHDLARMHTLLLAAGSAAAAPVRREAEGWGLDLAASPNEARARLGVSKRDAWTGSTTAGAAVPDHNLRPWTTSFIGRRRELDDLSHMLEREDHRLITLIGAGGVGKSRLAWQVASEQVRIGGFAGCWYVELEDLVSAEGLPQRIGAAVGCTGPRGSTTLEDVARWMGERRMLVVLDTCEHLAGVADAVSTLLAACPGVTVVATSRGPLQLAEEWRYPLEGFAPPGPVAPEAPGSVGAGGGSSGRDGVPDRSAVELFEVRARRASPRYRVQPQQEEHVAEICRLTGGSPLALELAAGCVAVMPLETIAEEIQHSPDFLHTQLRNVPERQRSLRAVFAHSWRTLCDEEREAMRRLAVFRGGFDRRSAQTVTGTGPLLLASLAAQSLVVEGAQGRFALHPLAQTYCVEALADRPDLQACIESRHAACFLAQGEAASGHVNGPKSDAWLAWLASNVANLEAALAYYDRRGDAEALAALAGVLVDVWIRRGHSADIPRWPDRLVAWRADATLAAEGRALPTAARVPPEGRDDALASATRRAEGSSPWPRGASGVAHALWLLGTQCVVGVDRDTARPLQRPRRRRNARHLH